MPRAYTLSEWVSPPAELLTHRLRQAVEAQNGGITRRRISPVPDEYGLEVSLDTFAQIFSSPDRSRCRVALRATLVEYGSRVIAQKTFTAEAAAPSPDAAGGVEGLVDASDIDIRNIITWLRETLETASTAASTESGRIPR